MKFELVQEFQTDPETFWRVFFDEEYNEALYRTALPIKERKLLAREETDQEIRRRVQVTPDEEIPPAFQKVIGGDMTYIEHTTWRKGSNEAEIRVELVSERLRPKFQFDSRIRVEPHGNGIRRTLSGEIKVKIPLMGGTIEKHVFKGIEENDRRAADFMRKWLAEH